MHSWSIPPQHQQPQQQFNAQETFSNAFNIVKEEVQNTANTVAQSFNPQQPQQPQQTWQPPQGGYQAPQAPNQGSGNNGKTLAIIGLVTGILSIVLSLFIGAKTWWIAIFAIASGVAGLILSAMGQKKLREAGDNSGMATAGLVCSIIGLALIVILIISCIACYACIACSGLGFLNGLSSYY